MVANQDEDKKTLKMPVPSAGVCVILAVVAFVVFVLLACWWGVYNILPNWEQRGQFGDMFGAVNALFSGLAFAGVVYALVLQQRELHEQRKDVDEQLDAMRKSANAQMALAETQRLAIQAEMIRHLRELLERSEEKSSRQWVYENEDKYQAGKSRGEDAIRHAERTSNTIDFVGILEAKGMIPVEFVEDNWGRTIRKCWDNLESYICRLRLERRQPELWHNFEKLAKKIALPPGSEKAPPQ